MEQFSIRAGAFLLPALLTAVCAPPSLAQGVISAGAGSYSAFPPPYKAKKEQNGPGFNATRMLTRNIFADEIPSESGDPMSSPGRPLPTNDWWTDIINNRYSGSLWSYPAMLRTSSEGVEICYPSYWADAGKEIKSKSSLKVHSKGVVHDSTIAERWGDWHVVFRMPDNSGKKIMKVTSAHGVPFTWFEFSEATPVVEVGSSAKLFGVKPGVAGIAIGNDRYGIYFPENADCHLRDGNIEFDGDCGWISVALLRDENDLDGFGPYAVSVYRDTRVGWSYDESQAKVNTEWHVSADNLRDRGSVAPVLQGFLPHAYKYALPGSSLHFSGQSYMTPRGDMKMATSQTGDFSYSYRFSGMLPAYPAPVEGDNENNPFDKDVLHDLISGYASEGSFGGDTYWGGKGLTQMALNMQFAKAAGDAEVYEKSKSRLREAFKDWLTYTPGEDTHFFSYYPRWGGMLGFDVSYDSDAFNDHHFHYGYFTYAAALLCLEDKDFAARYGELLKLIAKDYANWDREDTRFPFLRTLDPWCGHSWAGGLGDAGNDNGNGQESSSEAMQGWGGLYLLGVALGDNDMRDAGLFGWNTEARATREYWFDVDSPRGENAGGRKAWPGKGDRKGNYDYSEYPYAYNSNITGKGIGWWTWFGGDPLFMHGIQWMPASPALDYLSWDPDFVGWAYDDLMRGANSTYSHDWFNATSNTDNGDIIEPLASNDWGNVALTYLQRHDPSKAAEIFDTALEKGLHIATSVSTSHISYYLIHSHLSVGDPVFSSYSDCPTAQLYRKGDRFLPAVYNSEESDRTVNFYDENGQRIATVKAAPGRLTVFDEEAVASDIESVFDTGVRLVPGLQIPVDAKVVDQYGAGVDGAFATIMISGGSGAVIDSDNNLVISKDANIGDAFSITLSYGDVRKELTLAVEAAPVPADCQISGLPEIVESGVPVNPVLTVTPASGDPYIFSDARWRMTRDNGESDIFAGTFNPVTPGIYLIEALSSGEVLASGKIFVTPPMPEISTHATAIASSAENGACFAENVNDSDRTTRWGSNHTDNEWILLDLGKECRISRVAVDWEAAYASEYEIQVAPAESPMTAYTGDYAGRKITYDVPAESSYMTVLHETASSAGVRESSLNCEGRYLRIKGIKRGLPYGYSIYEMKVFGLTPDTGDDDIIGIDLQLPSYCDQFESVEMAPAGYTRSGKKVDVEVEWSSDLPAQFDGNTVTPHEFGNYTVTATVRNGGLHTSTSASMYVNEIERLTDIEISPSDAVATEGRPCRIECVAMNQFLAPYAGGLKDIEVRVLDQQGEPTSDATYDVANGIFVSSVPGDYTIDFGGMASASVQVVPISETNLALGRPASATSSLGGNKASCANDGSTDSRWESEWSQPHSWSVELDALYELSRFRIIWEGAYAKAYRILTSEDGDLWNEVYSTDASKGGTEEITISSRPARYVRIECIDRALPAYGFSIREFEVYCNRLIPTHVDSPVIGESDLPVRKWNMSGIEIPDSEHGIIISSEEGGIVRKYIKK